MTNKDHYRLLKLIEDLDRLTALVKAQGEHLAVLSEILHEDQRDRDNPPSVPEVRKNGARQPKTTAGSV